MMNADGVHANLSLQFVSCAVTWFMHVMLTISRSVRFFVRV